MFETLYETQSEDEFDSPLESLKLILSERNWSYQEVGTALKFKIHKNTAQFSFSIIWNSVTGMIDIYATLPLTTQFLGKDDIYQAVNEINDDMNLGSLTLIEASGQKIFKYRYTLMVGHGTDPSTLEDMIEFVIQECLIFDGQTDAAEHEEQLDFETSLYPFGSLEFCNVKGNA